MWVFSALVIAVGVQCWRPAFDEKSPNMGVDIIISMGIFGGIFVLIIFIVAFSLNSIISLIFIPVALVLISLAILRFGMNRLEKLE